jgi:enterochelin esterase family protein
MKSLVCLAVAFFLGASTLLAAETNSAASAHHERKPGEYPLGPDSLPQPGVPAGKLEGPFIFKSHVFTNTVRQYWIFVPDQYRAEKPACVLVFQDGQRAVKTNGSLRVPQVLANLIAKKEIPMTIGIFITPGEHGEQFALHTGNNPNNRSAEYDSLSDNYARFLCDEMLPEVGKTYNLTKDPEGLAIGGTSSGAICAFTVAWQRPDEFRKVISCIGSYTALGYRPAKGDQPVIAGGEMYPTFIRRTPIKPLTIFLQDGSHDLSNDYGDWFLSNQQMLSALEFANAKADRDKTPGPRYRLNHEWGDGAHADNHGGAILPDILRWLWQDYPK